MEEEELQEVEQEPTKPSNPLKRAKTTGKTAVKTTYNFAKKVIHFFASPAVPLPLKIAVISVVSIAILTVVVLDALADESVKAVDSSINSYMSGENVDAEGKKYFEDKKSLIKMPLKDINAMYEQFKDDDTFTNDVKSNYEYILGTKDIQDSDGNSSVNSASYDILNMVKKAVAMAQKGGIEYAKDGVGRQTASTLEELDALTRTDCSGLVWSLFKTYLNIDVGDGSEAMKKNGKDKKSENGWTAELHDIGDGELQPGDILYRSGHVGLYVGSYGTNNHVDHGGGDDGTTPGPNNTNYEGKGTPYTHYIRYTNPNASSGVVDPNGNDEEGYKAGFTDSKNRTYKIYCQYLEPWASKTYNGGGMQNTGCGPTSLAIIASGYGKNKTPGEIADYMTNKYGKTSTTSATSLSGTLKDFLEIKNKIITSNYESEIKMSLNAGIPVVISANNTPDTRFTKTSHIMTLLGIKNDSEVYIGNPGRNDSNTDQCGWNTLSDIIPYLGYVIILNE